MKKFPRWGMRKNRHYRAAVRTTTAKKIHTIPRTMQRGFLLLSVGVLVLSASGVLPLKFAAVLPGWYKKSKQALHNLEPLSSNQQSQSAAAADARNPLTTRDTFDVEELISPHDGQIDQSSDTPLAMGTPREKPTYSPEEHNQKSKFARMPQPTDHGQALPDAAGGAKPKPVRELPEERTATGKVYLNDDGSKTLHQSLKPSSYKDGDTWKDIDTSLQETSDKTKFQSKANSWQAQLDTRDIHNGITINKDGSSFAIKPAGGTASKPRLEGTGQDQKVTYPDVWPGVDVVYEIKSDMVKESLVIKSADAVKGSYEFTYSGSTLATDPTQPGVYKLTGAFSDFTLAAPSMYSQLGGIVGGDPYVTQTVSGNKIVLAVDQTWAKAQKKEAFPLVVDPSFTVGAATTYTAYRHDNYACGLGQGCGHLTGNSNNYYWRSVYQVTYPQLQGKTLISAYLDLVMPLDGDPQWGTYDNRYVIANHAQCWGFNCWDAAVSDAVALTGAGTTLNMTHIYQNRINSGDYAAIMQIKGEETQNYYSYKHFNAYASEVEFTYNTPTPATTPAAAAPADKAVLTTIQPSLICNGVTEADGDPVYYSFRVATNPDGETGVVINSPWQTSVQWTVPDGILQDGMTYYWRAYTHDGVQQTAPTAPSWTRSFRVDLRTGKDSTQTLDAAGAASVNMATGNLTTSAKTHDISALGGSMGLTMDYDSPQRSRQGLVGEYWNLPGSWSGTPPTTPANVTRVDSRIDFPWTASSPLPDVINNDWFFAKWTGYFVVPTTGSYQFGGHNDDNMKVFINNQEVYNSGCITGICYGSSVSLTAGQVVPIRVEHVEAVSTSFAQLFVKGAVAEQIVPTEWLQTGVRPMTNQYGLSGRYYPDSGNHVIPTDENQAYMARTDSTVNFKWGNAAPVAGSTTDNFLVRWKGYVTAPQAGTYYFYTSADDGSRVKINENTVWDRWNGGTSPATGVTLTQGQTVPITIEYYEATGSANIDLRVSGAVYDQIVPSTWLSPRVSALPAGWKLGADADGDLSYDHATVGSNSVVLYDSFGDNHEYTWTGSGYKPPANEDGQLTRNGDGTLTLQDIDGRTYIFNKDGTLQATSTPLDDRKPAALKYEYTGTPAKLTKIVDGVTNTRYGDLLYSGDTNCPTIPSGFGNVPTNMLCAYKTSDNEITKFFYSTTGQLARLELPGGEIYDYGYDTLGRIVQARDSLANDAITAAVRANDATATTEFTYDELGRVSAATMAAATTGATRMQHTYQYFVGDSRMHVTNMTEPNGFSRKITYDGGYRTVTDTDIANLTDTTEWDPMKDMVLSSTDETGLKSTTLYDHNDRPTHKYGPAPAAWFATDRTPQSGYASQVAHTESKYDENIAGLEAAYYNYGSASKTLAGSPKLHTTGIGTVDGTVNKTWNATVPITPDSGYNWGLRLTGEIKLANTGAHYFRPYSDDGVRVWIDDQLIVDSWNDGSQRWHNVGTYNNATANSYHRIRVDYYDRSNNDARLELYTSTSASGGGEALVAGNILSPKYGLTTTAKSYDASSAVGDTTTTTSYGSNPELGLAQSTSLDPSGINYQNASTYESPGGTNSYLRQLTKTLPGGTVTGYAYYDATETKDNPCTTGTTEAFKQAGRLKLKTETDPDGAGSQTSRTIETIYDDAGRTVATRINTDSWTCTTYDARDRVAQTVVPAYGSESARTITNNYAVGGDPLVTSSADGSGTITTWIDLLGRTVKYKDSHSEETTTTYDSLGRMTQRQGPLGTEVFEYDQYNRLSIQKLDNVVQAQTSYDAYGRMDKVDYPTAQNMQLQMGRDDIGRVNNQTYNMPANMLANPSLENATGNPASPTSWQTNSWGNNTPVFTYATDGHTGSRSVKTELTSYTSGDAKWAYSPLPVTPGASYTVTDWYKSNITSSFNMRFTHAGGSYSYHKLGYLSASSTWAQASYNFTVPSDVTEVDLAHVIEAVGWVQVDDAALYKQGEPKTVSDAVTRSQSGQVLTNTTNNNGTSATWTYGYDKASRLTTAGHSSGISYGYDFGTQDSTLCGTGTGTNPNSGKNSNRTSQTVTNPAINGGNPVTTKYCYDHADRLTGSSDTTYSNPEYDSHGNLKKIGTSGAPLELSYDSSDRNRGIVSYVGSGNGAAMFYGRDVQGRITFREKQNIASWNWTHDSSHFYGFTASGDTPDFVRDETWTITEKYLQLPGGVLLTIRPGQTGANAKTYSLPNIHGDTMATANASGVLAETYLYDPFGNKLSTNVPANTVPGSTYSWVGQHQKLTEKDLALTPVQMGARVYLPTIGRFASVDPVEGGVDNDYVYPPDPINDFDLDGNRCWKCIAKVVTNVATVASFIPGPIGMVASGVAVAGNLAQGNWAAAAVSAVGFIPGGKLAGSVASKSKFGTKALTKVMNVQARTRGIGAHSKLFGISGKLNNGPIRFGWSQGTKGRLNYRIGMPGSHKALLNYRFNTSYKFHNVLKGIFK